MRWIKSNDLRLIPQRLLENSKNEELVPERFMMLADIAAQFETQAGSVGMFVFYGVRQEVETALLATFDPVDQCIHLHNWWAVSLRENPGLVETIKAAVQEYGARGVKMVRSKIISLED